MSQSIINTMKQYRQAWGLTIKQLAHKIGINHNMLCGVECGSGFLPINNVSSNKIIAFFKFNEQEYYKEAYLTRSLYFLNKTRNIEHQRIKNHERLRLVSYASEAIDKLESNKNKGKDHWLRDSYEYMLQRLKEEVSELNDAETIEEKISEINDILNFSMFLKDKLLYEGEI